MAGRMEPGIKRASERYLEYLRSVRNSSPHTILNYGKDLEQFLRYLSPPGAEPPALPEVTHHLIREYVAHLHDQGLQKSITARGPERGREPSPPPRPRATRAALRRGASRQRVDWPQPGRHGSERASPARAWQRRQGAHCALRYQGADSSQCLLGGAHGAPAAIAADAS